MQLAFDESESLDMRMSVVKVVAKHEETSWLRSRLDRRQDATAPTTESYIILARNMLKRG
jgi:hypothetical protein